jgi:hypothetical protein
LQAYAPHRDGDVSNTKNDMPVGEKRTGAQSQLAQSKDEKSRVYSRPCKAEMVGVKDRVGKSKEWTPSGYKAKIWTLSENL